MPKKDKKPPVSVCPNCGKPITSGLSACRYCGSLLLPSSHPRPVPPPPQPYPGSPYQSETILTDTPKQARKTKEDAETELYKLNKGAAKAHIVTAIVLALTFVAAIVGASITYNDYKAALSEYEARTRPYLIIQNLEFNKTGDNTTYLFINMTNFGDRPARNIHIEDISLCAVAEEGCTVIHWTADERQEDTTVYPGRVRTTRIIVEEKDYQNILKT